MSALFLVMDGGASELGRHNGRSSATY